MVPRRKTQKSRINQIAIIANQTTDVETITLQQSNYNGSISGYINPIIEGATVVIKKSDTSNVVSLYIIESDGKYEFTGLDPSTYGISIRLNQGYHDYSWHHLPLKLNEKLSEINLILTPTTSKQSLDRIMIEFNEGVSENERKDIIESY